MEIPTTYQPVLSVLPNSGKSPLSGRADEGSRLPLGWPVGEGWRIE
jgi:hypothetical protein